MSRCATFHTASYCSSPAPTGPVTTGGIMVSTNSCRMSPGVARRDRRSLGALAQWRAPPRRQPAQAVEQVAEPRAPADIHVEAHLAVGDDVEPGADLVGDRAPPPRRHTARDKRRRRRTREGTARPRRVSANQCGRGSEPVMVVASGLSLVATNMGHLVTLASPLYQRTVQTGIFRIRGHDPHPARSRGGAAPLRRRACGRTTRSMRCCAARRARGRTRSRCATAAGASPGASCCAGSMRWRPISTRRGCGAASACRCGCRTGSRRWWCSSPARATAMSCNPSLHAATASPRSSGSSTASARRRCSREAGLRRRCGAQPTSSPPARAVPSLRRVYRRLGTARPLRPRRPSRADGAAPAPPPADDNPDKIVYLAFTSGTTGKPKGVMHSDNTLLANGRAMVARLASRRAHGPVVAQPAQPPHRHRRAGADAGRGAASSWSTIRRRA